MGIEIRTGRDDLVLALQPMAHKTSWLAVAAERAVSRAMGGSCSMPLAAHATLQGELLSLRAAWGDPEGQSSLITAQQVGPVQKLEDAQALGEQVAQALRRAGAG